MSVAKNVTFESYKYVINKLFRGQINKAFINISINYEDNLSKGDFNEGTMKRVSILTNWRPTEFCINIIPVELKTELESHLLHIKKEIE